MKRIVLIDGCDTYQCAGAPTMHLGQPVEVTDEIAANLLAQRCATGRIFLESADVDHRQVPIRLVDPRRDYIAPGVTAQGRNVAMVCASIAPYLLRLQRDGGPVFEAAGDA